MKITDIKVLTVRGNFEWNLVRLDTDTGLVGFGESYWGMGVPNLALELKRLIVGKDPTEPEVLVHSFHRASIPYGGSAGTLTTAFSGIEIATWDIYGKSTGLPVYKLLGGKFRDSIRIYCDCGVGEGGSLEPEAYAEKARKVMQMGFKALKFDLALPYIDTFSRALKPGELKKVSKIVEVLREVVGDDIELALDCHWRLEVRDAVKLAKLLEPYNLMWLEDPVPPENIEALARITSQTSTPICSGENLYTRYGFSHLIKSQAVDVASPDIPKVGGIVEGKKIADLAELYYITIAPHNVSSPLGTIAAVHLCASIPNFLALEFHSLNVPLWNKLLKEGNIIKDGYIRVPEKPGLGVELDRKTVANYVGEEAERFFEGI